MLVLRYSGFILLVSSASVVAGSAAAADGCAPGTYSAVHSPDGNATSFLFDDFSAVSGGSLGQTRASSSCNLRVPVTKANGYSVYNVDYRGYAVTANGQSAVLQSTKDGKPSSRYQIAGPLDGDVAFSQAVGTSSSSTMDLLVTVETSGPLAAGQPEAFFVIDTIDFARFGFASYETIQNSIQQLADQRQAITLDMMDTANDLLGSSDRYDAGSYFGVVGSTDASAGFAGRWAGGNGISFSGGAAFLASGNGEVATDDMALFAGSLRYTTEKAQFRAFGEIGLWGSPQVTAHLQRSYTNLDTLVQVDGAARGSLVNAFIRAGVIYSPNPEDEIALSARVTESWFDLDRYSETSDGNLFQARIADGTSRTRLVGADLSFSRDSGGMFDYTLTASVGRTAGKTSLAANVDFAGTVSAKAADVTFGSLSGRLGWKIDQRWKLDTLAGVTFREDSDPDWRLGTKLTTSF